MTTREIVEGYLQRIGAGPAVAMQVVTLDSGRPLFRFDELTPAQRTRMIELTAVVEAAGDNRDNLDAVISELRDLLRSIRASDEHLAELLDEVMARLTVYVSLPDYLAEIGVVPEALPVVERELGRQGNAEIVALLEDSPQKKQRSKKPALLLSDRIIMPRPFMNAALWTGPDYTRELNNVSVGNTRMGDAERDLYRSAAAAIDEFQIAGFGSGELRAWLAGLRVFSTDEVAFHTGRLTIPERLLCDAASISYRQTLQRRNLFDDLQSLAARRLYIPLRLEHEHTSVLVGKRVQLCEVEPIWKFDSTGDADSVASQWREHGPGQPWRGPLPDEYQIVLPEIMRQTLKAVVVGADLLPRLMDGARRVRGHKQGFHPLDFALFLQITQRHQMKYADRDGVPSYVDREAFLMNFYGGARLNKERGRCINQFVKAAKTLREGGIVAQWTPERGQRNGSTRDVFTLNPAAIVGYSGLVRKAARMAENA